MGKKGKRKNKNKANQVTGATLDDDTIFLNQAIAEKKRDMAKKKNDVEATFQEGLDKAKEEEVRKEKEKNRKRLQDKLREKQMREKQKGGGSQRNPDPFEHFLADPTFRKSIKDDAKAITRRNEQDARQQKLNRSLERIREIDDERREMLIAKKGKSKSSLEILNLVLSQQQAILELSNLNDQEQESLAKLRDFLRDNAEYYKDKISSFAKEAKNIAIEAVNSFLESESEPLTEMLVIKSANSILYNKKLTIHDREDVSNFFAILQDYPDHLPYLAEKIAFIDNFITQIENILSQAPTITTKEALEKSEEEDPNPAPPLFRPSPEGSKEFSDEEVDIGDDVRDEIARLAGIEIDDSISAEEQGNRIARAIQAIFQSIQNPKQDAKGKGEDVGPESATQDVVLFTIKHKDSKEFAVHQKDLKLLPNSHDDQSAFYAFFLSPSKNKEKYEEFKGAAIQNGMSKDGIQAGVKKIKGVENLYEIKLQGAEEDGDRIFGICKNIGSINIILFNDKIGRHLGKSSAKTLERKITDKFDVILSKSKDQSQMSR